MERNENNFVPFVPLRERDKGQPSSEIFDIDGLKIQAFYDSSHNLLFVLDLTQDKILPNVMLVVSPKEDRKWDDILENDFHIKPETIRPREGHKYKKLDTNYEGLDFYNEAITNKNAREVKKWRIAISDKLKISRITAAKKDEALARETIVKAKETISKLDSFIGTQKAKLKAAKKQIGKDLPKDSASKILSFEAKIEKAEAKKSRAKIRLRRAEKRVESSEKTVNNYTRENEMNTGDVKPLFTKEPNITETENAFKPIMFEPKQSDAPQTIVPKPAPVLQAIERPVSPSFGGAYNVEPTKPMTAPISGTNIKISGQGSEQKQGSGAYYMMLMILIGLSVFTLYLYKQKMGNSEMPHIATIDSAQAIIEPAQPMVADMNPENIPESVPESLSETILENAPALESVPETVTEQSSESPFIMDESVPTNIEPVSNELTNPETTDEEQQFSEPVIENPTPNDVVEIVPIEPTAEEQPFFQPITENPAAMEPTPAFTQEEPAVFGASNPETIEPDTLPYQPNNGVFEPEQYQENMPTQ